jgi:hypothetical protein
VLEFSVEGDAGSTWIRVRPAKDLEVVAQRSDPDGTRGWSSGECRALAGYLAR